MGRFGAFGAFGFKGIFVCALGIRYQFSGLFLRGDFLDLRRKLNRGWYFLLGTLPRKLLYHISISLSLSKF